MNFIQFDVLSATITLVLHQQSIRENYGSVGRHSQFIGRILFMWRRSWMEKVMKSNETLI